MDVVSSEEINLRLILVSGKTKEFLFSSSDSAGDIAQHVFDSWPEGKRFILCGSGTLFLSNVSITFATLLITNLVRVTRMSLWYNPLEIGWRELK
ncbi:hypothetical protein J437_LFUL001325 [Ladona fulva]|uniref:UBL3-like ubiquitin domain-containing protein n=1 Tax=Ladona fulva TaxID=123851 RepID=A0A8K0JU40_LADFU|nr:hypothetical protein J437_LFUL001325 [Ladona fulva]